MQWERRSNQVEQRCAQHLLTPKVPLIDFDRIFILICSVKSLCHLVGVKHVSLQQDLQLAADMAPTPCIPSIHIPVLSLRLGWIFGFSFLECTFIACEHNAIYRNCIYPSCCNCCFIFIGNSDQYRTWRWRSYYILA